MDKGIFDQLFEIKFGNRSGGYDVGNHIPSWNNYFEQMYQNFCLRKKLLEDFKFAYEQEKGVDVLELNFKRSTELFTRLKKIEFVEISEPVVAQHSLMLIYGIKICASLVPFINNKDDANSFFVLYGILQGILVDLQKTFKDYSKYKFWHSYCFKVALNLLFLSLKVREKNKEYFTINENYQIFQGQATFGHNPLGLIVFSVLPWERNDTLVRLLREEIVKIIEG